MIVILLVFVVSGLIELLFVSGTLLSTEDRV